MTDIKRIRWLYDRHNYWKRIESKNGFFDSDPMIKCEILQIWDFLFWFVGGSVREALAICCWEDRVQMIQHTVQMSTKILGVQLTNFIIYSLIILRNYLQKNYYKKV